jgi:AcrR family transcriptional regulator
MAPSPNSSESGKGSGKRRADARLNRQLLLGAAKDIFSERGVDAPLDDIARRAGVGNATMYRHFPTRRDLIIAVYADEVTDLCADGERLLNEEASADALFDWLRLFIAHVATKRELALAISDDRVGQRSALFDDWHAAMRSTTTRLLSRAQQAGSVRSDLLTHDLLALASGIALTGADSEQTGRLLRILRHGTDTG